MEVVYYAVIIIYHPVLISPRQSSPSVFNEAAFFGSFGLKTEWFTLRASLSGTLLKEGCRKPVLGV